VITQHALHRPVYGTAELDGGVLTVGVHADDTPARWPLTHRAKNPGSSGTVRHTTILGATGAGKTSLLRSIAHAATTAGIAVHTADADDLPAARTLLVDLHRQAAAHLDTTAGTATGTGVAGGRGLRGLLLIDDLDVLARDGRFSVGLTQLARAAAPTGLAVVCGTHEVTLTAFGGRYRDATLTRQALTQELVLLRTPTSDRPGLPASLRTLGIPALPPIPDTFPDGTTTAGVGYLPRRSTVPFRAWLP
jgi:hypothetical protein